MNWLGGALAVALAMVANVAQETRRVLVAPENELTLDLPEGWDPGRSPWSFATSRAGWETRLERSHAVDWPIGSIVAAAVAHVELDVVFADGATNGRVTIKLVGAVSSEEVSVSGLPEPVPGGAPPTGVGAHAIALSLERLDPTRETWTLESVDEHPAVERAKASSLVAFRCAVRPPPVANARRGWIVVPIDPGSSPAAERHFRVVPTDLSADDQCVAEPLERRAGASASLPRSRLAEATESLFWENRKQARQQLDDAAASYPNSADPIVRLVMERVREGQRDAAIVRGRQFLDAHTVDHPLLAKLVAWLASFPGDASVRCAPRRWRTEVFGDPRLPEELFAKAAGAAQETLLALERLHLADAETFVVLVDADDGGAKRTVEAEQEGWIALRRVEIAVPGLVDAPTALGELTFDLIDDPSHASMAQSFGPFALASWMNAQLGLGSVETRGERGSGGLATLQARRLFERDGPAALADFVRTGVVRPDQRPRDAADLIDHPPPATLRLQHLGHACFRLTADDGTRFLIDPFSSRYWLGTRFPWIFADGVAITHGHPDHDAIEEVAGAPRRLALDLSANAPTAQSVDFGPFHVQALKTRHDQRYTGGQPMTNLVLAVDVAGLRVVHLGDVQAPLDDELCARLDPVDVLLAPIDDRGHILDAQRLGEIVERLAPRVVIPMHYRVALPGSADVDDLGGIEKWLATIEHVRRLERDQVVLRRSELPSDTETWVFELAPWPEGRLEAVR